MKKTLWFVIIILAVMTLVNCTQALREVVDAGEETLYTIPDEFVELIEKAAEADIPKLMAHYKQLYDEQRPPTEEEYNDVMNTYRARMMDYSVGYSQIEVNTGKGRMLKVIARTVGAAFFGEIFNQ